MRAEEGWPIDTLLEIGAQTINGLSNRKSGARGHAADPDFVGLLGPTAFPGLRCDNLRVEMSKESKQEGTVMVISQKDLPPEIQADRELVRKLLGLQTARIYKSKGLKVGDTVSGKDDVIAMKTRSGFQILNLLGSNVEVPPEHIAERRTYPSIPEAGGITGRCRL